MASTFIRKERCEECGRKFTPKRDCFKNVTKDEIGLYFCSKKCDIPETLFSSYFEPVLTKTKTVATFVFLRGTVINIKPL